MSLRSGGPSSRSAAAFSCSHAGPERGSWSSSSLEIQIPRYGSFASGQGEVGVRAGVTVGGETVASRVAGKTGVLFNVGDGWGLEVLLIGGTGLLLVSRVFSLNE